MKRTLLLVGLGTLLASGIAVSQQAPAPAPSTHAIITGDSLKWGPPPPALPAGAEVAVLAGDPTVAGSQFTLRVKMPVGYKVPPHWHPSDEHVTVLQGALMVGMGDKFDEASMKTLTVGSFAAMPKEMRHYVQAKEAVIIQVHGTGPFALTYVNPADDPRKPPSN
jgi:quercetin dioxygenase-like cupin family protein